VLDISTFLAAPQVAAMLGDLGADVVKVEPSGGDPLRRIGAQRGGHSLMWALVNRNKRSITMDLQRAEGQALLRRLVPSFDVMVENQPIGTLERWGCTPEQLAEIHPPLVVVSVTCYGRTGPYAERPGAGTLAEAFGGLTFMTGESDGPPMLSSIPLGDTIVAMSGVIGTLAACYHRDLRGGTGQHVDVSMYEPILQLLASTIVAFQPEGPTPTRTGSRVQGGVPRNVYRTADDQWIVVSGTTDSQVARLLVLLGDGTTDQEAKFATSDVRLRHADELDGLVAGWVARLPRHQALASLLDARVPAAPVNDVAAILSDPHVLARHAVVSVPDDQLGPVSLVAPAPRLVGTPGHIRTAGPGIGAHNHEVYRELLGLDAAQIDHMAAEGVI
jgi:crotonobetainyl-CoA:carnitine CoA-transferase CaiB-like acyl-CoA transferase